jgi:hypothetical protein
MACSMLQKKVRVVPKSRSPLLVRPSTERYNPVGKPCDLRPSTLNGLPRAPGAVAFKLGQRRQGFASLVFLLPTTFRFHKVRILQQRGAHHLLPQSVLTGLQVSHA